MDSLDVPVGEEPSDDDRRSELPATQSINDLIVGTVRGLDGRIKTNPMLHRNGMNGKIVADCGILDACGMVYKPMGQRNTNPIGSEADEAAGPPLYAA
eukprot:1215436-Karenia_brevis.AAC.1